MPLKVRFAPEWDPVVQSTVGGRDLPGGTEIPGPIVTFNGQSNTSGVVPPDPNGAVGPNHIVTMCNLSFQIFNKSGTSLFGPAANNTLWAGFGGACQTENSGDPVVLYDRAADRWLLSQFTASGPPFFELRRDFAQPTIRPGAIFVMLDRDRELISRITRRLASGRMPTISARASFLDGQAHSRASERMR